MADIIKLLIVDDNEDMRDGIARLLGLELEGKLDIVGFAQNGAEAIERVKELQPDIVLMDINMPIMNGIDATAQITQIAPRTRVIMLTAQEDSTYLKQSFQAKAADYVTKPINPEELTDAITRVLAGREQAEAVAPPPPPTTPTLPTVGGRIVGVVGFKGGTGKTTLAINLAVGLAMAKKKVVLVDSDILFGDVSISLNTRGQRTILDLARIASDPEQLEPEITEQILTNHDNGLKLLLAPANPADAEPISTAAMTNLLDFLKQQFEYVIVDTSINMDEILLATVKSADRLLVVATATMSALKDTRFMFNELGGLEAMNKVILVLNQVERNGTITPEQIANHLKTPIAVQVPFDLTALNALNSGVGLITLDAKRAPAVKPLMDMVRLVIEKCETASEPA